MLSKKEVKPKKVIAEGWLFAEHINGKLTEGCGGMTASLRGLSNKVDSRTWGSSTGSGLTLVSEQQEPPHRQGVTAFTFLICSHSLNRGKIGSILPGLRRKKTGLLFSSPKSSFKMKVSFFAFHLKLSS